MVDIEKFICDFYNYSDVKSAIKFALKKQGLEIKDNKIVKSNPEPKFKVGDWIVFNGLTLYVKEVIQGYYRTIECIRGGESRPTIEWVDKTFHLWTIQDAKDGDVLWHSDSASNGIFIFKEIRHDGKVLCYCDYDSEDNFCTGENHTCCWSNAKYIKPATKEQRDLLFQKMKEAGYEWDAEKKEKQIKKNLQDNSFRRMFEQKSWSEEDEDMIQALNACIDATIKGGMHYISFGSKSILIGKVKNWLKSLKDRVQPKQKWSGEDESYLKSALWHISYAMSNGRETSIRCDLTEWLKSLKDRISQPKQEWSEEDKKMLENIKKTLYNLTLVEADGQAAFKKELAWLKSLKERYTWKPSGEQMKVLDSATENCAYSEYQDCLRELIEQLKKLREE